jgi:hypothetical protein
MQYTKSRVMFSKYTIERSANYYNIVLDRTVNYNSDMDISMNLHCQEEALSAGASHC